MKDQVFDIAKQDKIFLCTNSINFTNSPMQTVTVRDFPRSRTRNKETTKLKQAKNVLPQLFTLFVFSIWISLLPYLNGKKALCGGGCLLVHLQHWLPWGQCRYGNYCPKENILVHKYWMKKCHNIDGALVHWAIYIRSRQQKPVLVINH